MSVPDDSDFNLNEEETTLTTQPPRDVLGKPDGIDDDLFWTLRPGAEGLKQLIVASVGDGPSKRFALQELQRMDEAARSQFAIVRQEYLTSQAHEERAEIKRRIEKVEGRCESVLSGESKYACRHLDVAKAELTTRLALLEQQAMLRGGLAGGVIGTIAALLVEVAKNWKGG